MNLCKSFPDINCLFIYNRKKVCYKEISRNDLRLCLISLLKRVAKGEFDFLIKLTDIRYVDSVL